MVVFQNKVICDFISQIDCLLYLDLNLSSRRLLFYLFDQRTLLPVLHLDPSHELVCHVLLNCPFAGLSHDRRNAVLDVSAADLDNNLLPDLLGYTLEQGQVLDNLGGG